MCLHSGKHNQCIENNEQCRCHESLQVNSLCSTSVLRYNWIKCRWFTSDMTATITILNYHVLPSFYRTLIQFSGSGGKKFVILMKPFEVPTYLCLESFHPCCRLLQIRSNLANWCFQTLLFFSRESYVIASVKLWGPSLSHGLQSSTRWQCWSNVRTHYCTYSTMSTHVNVGECDRIFKYFASTGY